MTKSNPAILIVMLTILLGAPGREGLSGAESGVEQLTRRLEHWDDSIRREAARELGELGDPEAVEALIASLDDPGVRSDAARALAKIGDARAAEPLRGALWGASGRNRDVEKALGGILRKRIRQAWRQDRVRWSSLIAWHEVLLGAALLLVTLLLARWFWRNAVRQPSHHLILAVLLALLGSCVYWGWRISPAGRAAQLAGAEVRKGVRTARRTFGLETAFVKRLVQVREGWGADRIFGYRPEGRVLVFYREMPVGRRRGMEEIDEWRVPVADRTDRLRGASSLVYVEALFHRVGDYRLKGSPVPGHSAYVLEWQVEVIDLATACVCASAHFTRAPSESRVEMLGPRPGDRLVIGGSEPPDDQFEVWFRALPVRPSPP